MMRGFVWFQNYVNFFTDSEFWHTVQVSLEYTVLTVGVELVFGLGIAMLLQKRTRINNIVSILLLLPLMTAPAIAALMWKLMTNPNFGVLSYLVQLLGSTISSGRPTQAPPCSPSSSSTSGSTRPSS